jgi:hypothetical protein
MKAPVRAALVAPVTFTDLNAEAVTGLKARPFREFVREHHIPHARVGRRIVVRVDRFLEAIDRLSGAKPLAAWSEDNVIELAVRGHR